MSWWIGFISSFRASSVEVVEAVTIVLAADNEGLAQHMDRGYQRGAGAWSAGGVCWAGLRVDVPLPVLRVVIGTLLLILACSGFAKRSCGIRG